MNQCFATLLRLLLVTTLVLQPVLSAIAMGNMTASTGVEVSAAISPEMDGACAHHLPGEDEGAHSAYSGTGDHSTFDDCCSTPACHAVGILSFVPSLQPVVVDFAPLFESPLRGIVLSAEGKPPRASHA